MRFSVLAVELSTQQAVDSRELLHDIAEFAARENVTCILLTGKDRSLPSAQAATPTASSHAETIASELSNIGLRYETLLSHPGSADAPSSRSALLTQLSLLAEIRRDEVDQTAAVAAGRLAVAPRSAIDAYSVVTSGQDPHSSLKSALELVDATEEILAKREAERPRRRGPIRRGPKVEDEPVRTRFVCLAGPSTFGQDAVAHLFSNAKLTRVSQPGGAAPAVFVRPAIKPVASTDVTLAVDGGRNEQASFVAFDL